MPNHGAMIADPGQNRLGPAALCLMLGLLLVCGCARQKPPNVVLIVFDALRPDHVGAYGYDRPTTPHLDELAKESILFEQVTASASFTLPSMATVFTGLEPIDHNVRRHLDPEGIQDRLESHHETLAETLKAHGYATAAAMGNSLFLYKFGFEQGFDFFDAGQRRDAEPNTDVALNWLKDHPKDQPFFLWVHYIDPHWPYNAPANFKRPFHHPDDGQFRALVEDFKQTRVRGDQIYFDNRLDPDGVKAGIAEYDNEIAYADAQMGRLIEYLKRSGLYEDTIIVVISDHGESLGEHDLFFAHSFFLYNEIQQCVWVLKPAGKRKTVDIDDPIRIDRPVGHDDTVGVDHSVRIDHPVRLLDLYPTLLGMLDMKPGRTLAGIDLQPLWSGNKEKSIPELPVYAEAEPRYRSDPGEYRYPSRKRVYMEGNVGKWRMIQAGGYKLIHIPGEGVELYDLENDPQERNNIAEASPEVVRRLSQMLNEYLKRDAGEPEGSPRALEAEWEEALKEIRAMGYGN